VDLDFLRAAHVLRAPITVPRVVLQDHPHTPVKLIRSALWHALDLEPAPLGHAIAPVDPHFDESLTGRQHRLAMKQRPHVVLGQRRTDSGDRYAATLLAASWEALGLHRRDLFHQRRRQKLHVRNHLGGPSANHAAVPLQHHRMQPIRPGPKVREHLAQVVRYAAQVLHQRTAGVAVRV
jgi:hypothetical protein